MRETFPPLSSGLFHYQTAAGGSVQACGLLFSRRGPAGVQRSSRVFSVDPLARGEVRVPGVVSVLRRVFTSAITMNINSRIMQIAQDMAAIVATVQTNPTAEGLGHGIAKIRAFAASLEELADAMEKQLNAYRELVKG